MIVHTIRHTYKKRGDRLLSIADMTIIGSGAQADVYLFVDRVYKVYKHGYPQEDAFQEAKLHKKAFESGLPVPEIYDVVNVDGRPAIVMEYIPGITLGDAMRKDSTNAERYLQLAVELQIKTHKVRADGFPNQMERLTQKITRNAHLDSTQRDHIMKLCAGLKPDNALCHGDFHVHNLLQTPNGVKIIDWVDSCSGNADIDVCRTYLLYFLYRNELSDVYLETYCNITGTHKNDILTWLPVISAARLDENVIESDVITLLQIINDFTGIC